MGTPLKSSDDVTPLTLEKYLDAFVGFGDRNHAKSLDKMKRKIVNSVTPEDGEFMVYINSC